jgi:hypothetical protein
MSSQASGIVGFVLAAITVVTISLLLYIVIAKPCWAWIKSLDSTYACTTANSPSPADTTQGCCCVNGVGSQKTSDECAAESGTWTTGLCTLKSCGENQLPGYVCNASTNGGCTRVQTNAEYSTLKECLAAGSPCATYNCNAKTQRCELAPNGGGQYEDSSCQGQCGPSTTGYACVQATLLNKGGCLPQEGGTLEEGCGGGCFNCIGTSCTVDTNGNGDYSDNACTIPNAFRTTTGLKGNNCKSYSCQNNKCTQDSNFIPTNSFSPVCDDLSCKPAESGTYSYDYDTATWTGNFTFTINQKAGDCSQTLAVSDVIDIPVWYPSSSWNQSSCTDTAATFSGSYLMEPNQEIFGTCPLSIVSDCAQTYKDSNSVTVPSSFSKIVLDQDTATLTIS